MGPDWIESRLERWRTARDSEALGELLKWQRLRAYATAWHILHHEWDAEDAVQQAFLKMLSRTQGFDSAQDFQTALYRAVVQCALDLARARQTRQTKEQGMSYSTSQPPPNPQAVAEKAEALRLVREETDGLLLEDRALLALCVQEGLNLTQAAAALEMPRETARDRLAGTFQRLRRRLQQRGLAFSLLPLLNLLRQGPLVTAPQRLCQALDAKLPGAPCERIPEADLPALNPAELVAESNPPSAGPRLLKFAAALLLAVALAVLAIRAHQSDAPPAGVASAEPSAPGQERDSTGRLAQARQVHPAVLTTADASASAPANLSSPAKAAPRLPAAQVEMDPAEAAARQAAVGALPGLEVTKVEREGRGATAKYEVAGQVGGRRYEVTVNAAGQVLQLEEDPEGPDQEAPRGAQPAPAPKEEF